MRKTLYHVQCCILGSIRSILSDVKMPNIDHSWVSETGEIPICGHSFAMSQHVNTYLKYDADDCANICVDQIEICVGRCRPRPLALQDACDIETVLGKCVKCDEIEKIEWRPEPISDCEIPTIVDGKIVWEDKPVKDTYTQTGLARWLLEERELFNDHMKHKICECLMECGDEKNASKLSQVLVTPWCDGIYVGHMIKVDIVR